MERKMIRIKNSKVRIAAMAVLVSIGLILLIQCTVCPILKIENLAFDCQYESDPGSPNQFDCSNTAAFVFKLLREDGRNVTIEFGSATPTDGGHAWVGENERVIYGGDEKWIRENFLYNRYSFSSIEEAEKMVPGEWNTSQAWSRINTTQTLRNSGLKT